MGETYTGDRVTLEDVLGSDFLMLHEVIEINELKRTGVSLANKTLARCDRATIYDAHLTATEYKIKYALSKDNH